MKITNRYEINGEVTTLFLERRNGEVFECTIDTEDAFLILPHRWSYRSGGYASRTVTRKGIQSTILMHRAIAKPTEGTVVDHIDNNQLNNCKVNLRVVTQAENCQNRSGPIKSNKSGVRGVTRKSGATKWFAQVKIKGVTHKIGYFYRLEDAEAAVKEARASLHPFSKEGMAAAQEALLSA